MEKENTFKPLNWSSLVQVVSHHVYGGYRYYRVGITQNIPHREQKHGFPEDFVYWPTKSLDDAQEAERILINRKGMQGGTGGDLKGGKQTFLYIFKE